MLFTYEDNLGYTYYESLMSTTQLDDVTIYGYEGLSEDNQFLLTPYLYEITYTETELVLNRWGVNSTILKTPLEVGMTWDTNWSDLYGLVPVRAEILDASDEGITVLLSSNESNTLSVYDHYTCVLTFEANKGLVSANSTFFDLTTHDFGLVENTKAFHELSFIYAQEQTQLLDLYLNPPLYYEALITEARRWVKQNPQCI